MYEHSNWLFDTYQYLGTLLNATFMALRPTKERIHLLRVNTPLGRLYNFIVNTSSEMNCEEYVKFLKELSLECRNRAIPPVNALIDIKAETTEKNLGWSTLNKMSSPPWNDAHDEFLGGLPKKFLIQLGSIGRALPRRVEATMEQTLVDFKANVCPKDFLKQQKSFNEQTQEIIAGMSGYNRTISIPSHLKVFSTSGCLENTTENGGANSVLSMSIPSGLKLDLYNLPLEDLLEEQAWVLNMVYRGALSDTSYHEHDCKVMEDHKSRECILKHTPVNLLNVYDRGWKVRTLTMYEAQVRYLVSNAQRHCTHWLRNNKYTADALEPHCSYFYHINAWLKTVPRHERVFFHSGDFVACTDHFIPRTSLALLNKILDTSKSFTQQQRSALSHTLVHNRVCEVPIAIRKLPMSKAKMQLIADYLDDPNNGFIMYKGQPMGNPLSFPIMGAMQTATYTFCFDKANDTPLVEEQWEIQLVRRAIEGDKTGYLILGLMDSGEAQDSYWGKTPRYHGGENKEGITAWQRDQELWRDRFRNSIALKLDFEVTLNNLDTQIGEYGLPCKIDKQCRKKVKGGKFHHDRWKWQREVESGKFEYKRARGAGDKPPKNYIGIEPVLFIYSIREGSANINFVSDEEIIRNRNKMIEGQFKSVAYNYQYKVGEEPKFRTNQSPTIYYGIGDDHLGVSISISHIRRVRKAFESYFNMTYNRKSDMISDSGCLIAERFALYKPRERRLIPVNYCKVRQLVTERQKSETSWIDRAGSIRSQILSENYHRNGLDALQLYITIEGYERVFNLMISRQLEQWQKLGGLDPRILKTLGGFGLPGTGITMSFDNRITRRHMRILAWCSRSNNELGFKYLKGMKKASSTSETIQVQPWKRDWITEFQKDGVIPVRREWVKQLIIRYSGWLWVLDMRTHTREKTLEEIYWQQLSQVSFYYNLIKYDLLKIPFRSNPSFDHSRPPRNRDLESYKDLHNPKWGNMQSLLEDPREILVSVDSLLRLRKMERNWEMLHASISESRQSDKEIVKSEIPQPLDWYPMTGHEIEIFDLNV